jgi:hypothetical protein
MITIELAQPESRSCRGFCRSFSLQQQFSFQPSHQRSWAHFVLSVIKKIISLSSFQQSSFFSHMQHLCVYEGGLFSITSCHSVPPPAGEPHALPSLRTCKNLIILTVIYIHTYIQWNLKWH